MRKPKKAQGFTLIELMVVGGIIAVLGSLAVSGFSGISERAAPQNAAYDLSAAFAKARARAAERNTNVYVMIWPAAGNNGNAGEGAWVLYEDEEGDFDLGSSVNSFPHMIADSANGKNKVLVRKYLSDYAKRNVKFGNPSGGAMTGLSANVDTKTAADSTARTAMFTQLSSKGGCTFCSGTGAAQRGAVVFTPDGEARFVNANGDVSYSGGSQKLLMVDSSGEKRAFLFVISQPTSFVSFFSH